MIFIPSDYLKTSTVIRVEEGGFRFLQESSPLASSKNPVPRRWKLSSEKTSSGVGFPKTYWNEFRTLPGLLLFK